MDHKGRRLTIWDEDGRELVCIPVEEEHYIKESRNGMYCKVMSTDGDKGFSHVYFDDVPFSTSPHRKAATFFFQKGIWWRSFVHIKGWSFNFTPPKSVLLKKELTVLAARMLEINRELDYLK